MDNKKKKEMEESEEKYKILFNSNPEALLYVDKDFKIVDINPRFEELFGYSIDEIRGKDINEFIVPKNRRDEGQKLDKKSKEGYTFYETVRKKKDGTLVPVSISAAPVISRGSIIGITVTYKDITKRKEMEKKLSAIYDLSKEMALSFDLDQISKIVLDAAEKVLNFGNIDLFLIDEEKNELYVKESRGLKEPEGYTVIPLSGEKGITAHVARTGKSLNVPDVRKDERYLFGLKGSRSELCVPIKIKDKVIGVIDAESKELNAFSKEDQRLLENLASQTAIAIENARFFRELSSLKEFNETIVSSLNEGIWVEDEKGFCTYANPKMKEMVGYDTLTGKHWKEIVAPEEIEHIERNIREKPYERKYETILLRSDGKKVPTIISVTPLFENEKYKGTINVMVDISKQKTIEERLKESEKLYKSLSEFNKNLLENSPIGIMNINKEMKVEYENPEMRRILGLPFGRELSATWKDIREVPFVEETGISSIFDDLKKGKEIFKEISFTFPGGEKGYITLKGVPILEDSKFAGAVLIVNDITERKKMEVKLRKSEERFRMLFKNNPEAIAYLTPDGYILDINPRFSELFGYSLDEIKDKHINEVVVPKDKIEEAKRLDRESIRGGYASCVTVRKRKDGSLVPVSVSGGAVIVEGSKTGMLAVYKDITEVKKAEEKLKESEKRFRDVALSSADWIWEVDKNGRYTFASGKVKQILGYDPEEIIGKTPLELMPKEEAERMGKILEKIASEKKPIIDLENWNLTKKGEKVCFLTNGIPIIDEKGGLLGYRGVDKDITERKRMEEILKHRLSALTQPLSEVSELKLTDIIDIEILQKIQDAFAHALGVASIILDLDCNPITKESNYCEVCRLIRKTVKGKNNCTESGITLSKKVKESMKTAMHSCQSIGFLEACVPIVVGGKHIANWFIGQSNTMDVDAKRIREYGKEIGADVDAMLAAFEKMPEMPIEKFKQILSLLWQIALDLSAYAYSTLRLTNEINMRKRAEEVLKEERDRAQKYLDVAGVLMVVLNADQKVSLINKKGCEILGYKEKEIIGKNWTDNFVPERNRDEVKTVLKKLFAGEIESVEYNENVILTKSGKERIIAWHNSVLKDEAGNIIGILSSGEDITERKKMEAELRESEERYRTTFENTGTAMAILEKDATISLANSRFEKLSGYSKEEIEGKMKWTEFVHPDDLKKMMEYHKERRVNPEEVPKQYEFRAINKNGNILYMLLNVDLIPGTKQSIVSLIDITERKKVEEKLRESEEKLRNFVQSSTIGIWCFRLRKTIDITLSEEKMLNEFFKATCVECNETYAKMMGTTKNEILGMELSEVMPNTEENREYLKAFIRNGFKLSGGISHEINKKGKEKFFSNSLVGTIENDKLVEVWGTQTDITERKLLERQREKARKEAEFYSDLLGHDIGNLNQVILGYLYLLKNAKDEETRKKNVEGIKKSIMKSKRLAESIRILKIIKDTKIEKFNLNKSIERSIRDIKEYFDREIKINLNIKKEYHVKANDFLDRVFFNILENSVEYTFHDPVIIDIEIEEKDDFCNIHIRDNGIGIPKEKREDILRNLETLSKRTGIGLYLTKKILDRFDGKFEIKDVEKGTEIVISIPVIS